MLLTYTAKIVFVITTRYEFHTTKPFSVIAMNALCLVNNKYAFLTNFLLFPYTHNPDTIFVIIL